MNKTKPVTALIALSLALGVLACAMGVLIASEVWQSGSEPAVLNQPATDFVLPDLTGKSWRLTDLRGRAVVLFFGSHRCPVSRDYRARLDDLAQSLGQDALVLAINSDTGADDPGLTASEGDYSLAGAPPTLLDPTAGLARTYGVRVTPTVVVIGPLGYVRYVGAFDDNRDAALARHAYARDAAERVLDATPVSISSTQAFGQPLRWLE